jgi:hypothetical protein
MTPRCAHGRCAECPVPGIARHRVLAAARARDRVGNLFGGAHEVRNRYRADGSQLTSSASEHPAMTIAALAIRQAGHIARPMRRREL